MATRQDSKPQIGTASNKGRKRTESTERETNRATTRVLAVLAEFANEPFEFGVTEVADRLKMTKNMVFRALNTLVDQGYLVRSRSGRRYELGYRVVELANTESPEPDLRMLASPFLSRMQKVTGETSVLTIRMTDTVVVIDGVEGPHAVGSRVPLGASYPLHISPTARAVLASLTDEGVESYISRNAPLRRLTDTTIVEPNSLRREVALIRSQGYALGYGDATPGKVSVAFPILDAELQPWGAIATGGPGERFSHERLRELMPELRKIAGELNARSRFFTATAKPAAFA